MKEAEAKTANTGTSLLDVPPIPTTGAEAKRVRDELDALLMEQLGKYASEDTSLVVFGSLARGEWTAGSDLDWTYLVDSQANSDHLRIAQKIGKVVRDHYTGPGATGTFGNLAFSHELIHQIGGQYDTNENTTQRILLLLESTAIGTRSQAYDRVILGVINRYLEEDTHLLSHDSTHYRVPRFLLNDIVRFWRTMAVDFASKQRDREEAGWGLRNAKLRMSRKLIFASGLLVCFNARLDPELKKLLSSVKSTDDDAIKSNLANHIRSLVMLTPLEVLEKSVHDYGVQESVGKDLFGAYGEFLLMLADEGIRKALAELRAKDSRTDPTFRQVRKVSERFEKALDAMFFENPLLEPLTRKYGVF
jgi:Nucleotidyltransferase domain